MRILVCGDRNWAKKGVIKRIILQSGATLVIHGAARGADRMAGEIAEEFGLSEIACPAKWDEHGKAAGVIRNQEMLKHKPDIVFAFHEDLSKSKGTKDMVERARKAGIQVINIIG